MKKTGLVLSGCGVYDGSKIHEAVMTLLAIARAVCFAPDKPRHDVMGTEKRVNRVISFCE